MAKSTQKTAGNMQMKHIAHRHIDSLSDGVFSIALTLLGLDVLSLARDLAHAEDLNGALFGHWPVFFAYALGFFVLYAMWYSYHATSQYVISTNAWVVWQHGLVMAIVALVPFTTALLAESLNTPNMTWGVFYFGVTVFGNQWTNALLSLPMRGNAPIFFSEDFPIEQADQAKALMFFNITQSLIGLVLVLTALVNPWIALCGYILHLAGQANPVRMLNTFGTLLSPRFFRLKPEVKRTK
jgi:uncharacterized membrane protein